MIHPVKKIAAAAAPAAEAAAQEAPKAETKTKKAPAKKAEKKPAAKKAPARKSAPKTNLVVEYQGRQIMQADILAGAERVWAEAGRTEAIQSMDLYVKPEDSAVYCVINCEAVGTFSF